MEGPAKIRGMKWPSLVVFERQDVHDRDFFIDEDLK